jgi:hypothetical protein
VRYRCGLVLNLAKKGAKKGGSFGGKRDKHGALSFHAGPLRVFCFVSCVADMVWVGCVLLKIDSCSLMPVGSGLLPRISIVELFARTRPRTDAGVSGDPSLALHPLICDYSTCSRMF